MNYEISQEIAKLSVAERIQLVEDIWDSVARDNGAFELTQERKAELEKRSRDFKANPAEGRTWEQIQGGLP